MPCVRTSRRWMLLQKQILIMTFLALWYVLIAGTRSILFVGDCFHFSYPTDSVSRAMEPKLKCAKTDTPAPSDALSFISDICGTLKKLKRTMSCQIESNKVAWSMLTQSRSDTDWISQFLASFLWKDRMGYEKGASAREWLRSHAPLRHVCYVADPTTWSTWRLLGWRTTVSSWQGRWVWCHAVGTVCWLKWSLAKRCDVSFVPSLTFTTIWQTYLYFHLISFISNSMVSQCACEFCAQVDKVRLLRMTVTHDLCEALAGDITPYCDASLVASKHDKDGAASRFFLDFLWHRSMFKTEGLKPLALLVLKIIAGTSSYLRLISSNLDRSPLYFRKSSEVYLHLAAGNVLVSCLRRSKPCRPSAKWLEILWAWNFMSFGKNMKSFEQWRPSTARRAFFGVGKNPCYYHFFLKFSEPSSVH